MYDGANKQPYDILLLYSDFMVSDCVNEAPENQILHV